MSIIFPKWTNSLPTVFAVMGVGVASTVVGAVWYYFTPKFWDVGYQPTQPGGGFNHQIHAGKLGIDCRYCHSHIEESAEANIPAVETCFGCHADGKLKNQREKDHAAKTDFIRAAFAEDKSIPWRRVHKLPDYVRNFPHQAHIAAGVSCYSCHGNMAREVVVNQKEPLSMGWCLECHRNVAAKLVPTNEVTRLFDVEKIMTDETPEQRQAEGETYLQARKLNPPDNCGACHY